MKNTIQIYSKAAKQNVWTAKNMPFKIIQTRENGSLFLTFCPEQWESDGKLFWPQSLIQGEKLRKKEDSLPGKDWKVLDCEVKRRNLTLTQAKLAIKAMSDLSETEEEDEKSKSKKIKINEETICLNNLAEQYITGTDHTKPAASTSATVGALEENVENVFVIPNSDELNATLMYINKENCTSGQHDLKYIEKDINIIKGDIKSINEDIKTMMQSLNLVLENQGVINKSIQQLSLKVTESQVMNEELAKKYMKEKQIQALELETIKNVKDLEEFENNLKDTDYRKELQSKLSALCIKGKGKGTTSAYVIVDVLFERQFFKTCSWTGVSRSDSENKSDKICFKAFSKTTDFFFHLIRQHDSSFQLDDCHKFFKTILRNADQRCKQSQRASTKKCRAKKNTADETPAFTSEQFPMHIEVSSNQEVEDIPEVLLDLSMN